LAKVTNEFGSVDSGAGRCRTWPYSDTDPYSHTYPNSDSNSNAYPNTYPNSNPNTDTNAYSNANT